MGNNDSKPNTDATVTAAAKAAEDAKVLQGLLDDAWTYAYKAAVQNESNETAVGHHFARLAGALKKHGVHAADSPALRAIAAHLAMLVGVGDGPGDEDMNAVIDHAVELKIMPKSLAARLRPEAPAAAPATADVKPDEKNVRGAA